MIADARGRGANFAADNLQYFIDGKGGARKVPIKTLIQYDAFKTSLDRNHQRHEQEVMDVATQLKDGETRVVSTLWDAVVDPRFIQNCIMRQG